MNTRIKKRIKFREIKLTFSDDVPLLWFGGNNYLTCWLLNLSLILPALERLMIKTVKKYSSEIKDEDNLNNYKSFIRQEAQHYKLHEEANDLFRRQGYQVDNEMKLIEYMIEKMELRFSDSTMLSACCFMEHCTAVIGRYFLGNPNLTAKIHPDLRRLVQWHAAEEIEHKAVLHDIFMEVDGRYWKRMLGVFAVLFSGILMTKFRIFRLMNSNGSNTGVGERLKAVRIMKRYSTSGRVLSLKLKDYIKPGYHPDDEDDYELIEEWISV